MVKGVLHTTAGSRRSRHFSAQELVGLDGDQNFTIAVRVSVT
jgi:hypothetical protein